MAQLPVNFDATQVEPNAPLEVIPADFYNASITSSEMKPTKEKGGSYCALELTILDGQYAGRKLFDNLNLVNKNQTAVEIAYRTLSAICHAVGVFNVQDTQQLHGLPLQVKVGIQAAEGDYEARNVIKGYKAIEGQAAPGAVANAAPPWAGQQQAQAPAPAPVAAAPAPAPAPAPQPIKTMTAKAGGATYQQFVDNGWSDEQMVSEGYLEISYPAPAPAPAPSATPPWQSAAPATPQAPAMPAASAASTQAPPPWAK